MPADPQLILNSLALDRPIMHQLLKVRLCHCSLFRVACKQRSADILPSISLTNSIETQLVTKQPSEHYYLSHATFPFPPDRLLRQAACCVLVYLALCIFGFLGQFLAA
jgi:hypothetical protein